MANPFLSDAWLADVQQLAAEEGAGLMPDAVQINMVVTGTPEGDKEFHVAGKARSPRGFSPSARPRSRCPTRSAKSMFVNGETTPAAMPAFMAGQIKIEGDMARLMALQTQAPSVSADSRRPCGPAEGGFTSDLD